MGWTNLHLHHFRIGEQLYDDPDLMQENFEDMEYKDSTTTKVSDILPRTGRRFRFQYEYDFGDNWMHQLIVEERFPPEKGVKYPLCVAGQRACPPEDCGGPWAYPDFLETISNPDHRRHEETLEWVGGEFDPERFDLEAVNNELRRMRTRKP